MSLDQKKRMAAKYFVNKKCLINKRLLLVPGEWGPGFSGTPLWHQKLAMEPGIIRHRCSESACGMERRKAGRKEENHQNENQTDLWTAIYY